MDSLPEAGLARLPLPWGGRGWRGALRPRRAPWACAPCSAPFCRRPQRAPSLLPAGGAPSPWRGELVVEAEDRRVSYVLVAEVGEPGALPGLAFPGEVAGCRRSEGLAHSRPPGSATCWARPARARVRAPAVRLPRAPRRAARSPALPPGKQVSRWPLQRQRGSAQAPAWRAAASSRPGALLRGPAGVRGGEGGVCGRDGRRRTSPGRLCGRCLPGAASPALGGNVPALELREDHPQKRPGRNLLPYFD